MLISLRAGWNRFLVASVALVFAIAFQTLPATARADDGQPAQRAAATSKAAEIATANIHRWIGLLDSDSFADREDSAQRLFDAGSDAIKPMTEAVRGNSYEQTAAAIGVLRRLLRSDNAETGKAARAALEEIAQAHGDSAARLASDALEPPVELPPVMYPQVTPGMRRMNVMRVRAMQIQVQAQIQVGVQAQMPIVPAVVVETTVAHVNGKKIQIDEDAQNGIRMRVTENVKGVSTVKTYQAKRADELKQKSPDAHKIYESAKGSKEAMHFQGTESGPR